MAALPRGIQLVQWKNTTDGSVSMRYRVRIKRQDLKADNLYTDLAEAVQFLALTKTKSGREMLSRHEETAKQDALVKEEEEMFETIQAMGLDKYHFIQSINLYKQGVIEALPDTLELDRRKKDNLLSFLRTIERTNIEHVVSRHDFGSLGVHKETETRPLSMVPFLELTPYHVNNYIKTRLIEGKKKSTVSREISIISQIIEHQRAEDDEYANFINPVLHHNKKLLANQQRKKRIRLTAEENEKIFEGLRNYSNPQMRQICEIALATACRRSEIITLRWDMVKDTHLALERTKSGEARNVYLTDEAKAVLNEVERRDGEPRIFWSYGSIGGFEGSFTKLMRDTLKLPHITFHVFRKEAFSRFFDAMSDGTTTVLAQFLGVKSVRKFEELHAPKVPKGLSTEKDIQTSGGHASSEVGNRHYYTPGFTAKKNT